MRYFSRLAVSLNIFLLLAIFGMLAVFVIVGCTSRIHVPKLNHPIDSPVVEVAEPKECVCQATTDEDYSCECDPCTCVKPKDN